MAQPRNMNITREERMLQNVRQFKLLMTLAADEVENVRHNRWSVGQFGVSHSAMMYMETYWRELNQELWKGCPLETNIPLTPEKSLDYVLLPEEIATDDRNLRHVRNYRRHLQMAGDEIVDMRAKTASARWAMKELAQELLRSMNKFWERKYMEVWSDISEEEQALWKTLELHKQFCKGNGKSASKGERSEYLAVEDRKEEKEEEEAEEKKLKVKGKKEEHENKAEKENDKEKEEN